MEKILDFNERIARCYDDNSEYLNRLYELYLDYYNDYLLGVSDFDEFLKVKAYMKGKKLDFDGIKAVRTFVVYGYVDADFLPKYTPIDLDVDLSKVEAIKRQLKNGRLQDGVITPDGKYYVAYGGHYVLNSWLMLNGVDTRKVVRVTTVSGMTPLLVSDMDGYCKMDDNPLMITPAQARAMYNLYKINKTHKDSNFQSTILESHKYGFLRRGSDLQLNENLSTIENEVEAIHRKQGITPRNILDGFDAREFRKVVSRSRITTF